MADAPYQVPVGTLPLLAGLLEFFNFAHRDMARIIADLPAEALAWMPAPEMGSLSGIVRHTMYCEEYAIRRAAGEDATYDEAYNASLWETADDAAALTACINAGDDAVKYILPTMTVERMAMRYAAWTCTTPTLSGALIAEGLAHTTMHWGHMQMTRQLWEQTQSDFVGTYERW